MGFNINGSMKGQIAFVFPGQGSQSIGMMNSFRKLPVVKRGN